jgi:ribosomal-protein-alanine N-acetyltransferase
MRAELTRCTLRPFEAGDVEALARHANDPLVSAYLRDYFPHPYTRGDAEKWVAFASGAGREDNLVIEIDGEAAGGVAVVPGLDVHRIRAEIGYWLGRAHWGKGVASEVAKFYGDHLLRDRGFLRLEAPVFAPNRASARVLEKAGFSLESTQPKAVIKRGVVLDLLLYVRLAPE